ncbi:MAG: hypothetical protein N2Z22_01120 [Turneriella sp.]|nr:hypothetical protein [Leptospiraceae bacterium]MCX7631913.1 hypothetical protein [Turneriella sp.]
MRLHLWRNGFLLLFFYLNAGCSSHQRDQQLQQLYRDGIIYIQDIYNELQQAHDADAATAAIRRLLPRLRALIERKKELEKKYPELRDSQRRESIHARFAEFHELRQRAQELYRYGSELARRYHNHAGFRQVSREGWELLAYF